MRHALAGDAAGDSEIAVPPTNFPLEPNGFIGGVQIGVNHQMANRFVIGAEADITYNALEGAVFDPGLGILLDGAVDWSGSARVRAGYALGRTLPYLTAGVAAAKYEIFTNDLGAGIRAPIHKETHIGWTLGAGVEHAFTDRWSARVEYRYSDFGEEQLSIASGIGAGVHADLSTHDIRMGLNYRF